MTQVKLQTAEPIEDTISNDQLLEVINQATMSQNFAFNAAQRFNKGNLTLKTNLTTSADQVVVLGKEVAMALNIFVMTVTNIYINSRWSQFLIHSIPGVISTTNTTETTSQMAQEILNFPSLSLAQPPRWISTPEDIKAREFLIMIVSFLGRVDFLGLRTMLLFNRTCQVEKATLSQCLTSCRKC